MKGSWRREKQGWCLAPQPRLTAWTASVNTATECGLWGTFQKLSFSQVNPNPRNACPEPRLTKLTFSFLPFQGTHVSTSSLVFWESGKVCVHTQRWERLGLWLEWRSRRQDPSATTVSLTYVVCCCIRALSIVARSAEDRCSTSPSGFPFFLFSLAPGGDCATSPLPRPLNQG